MFIRLSTSLARDSGPSAQIDMDGEPEVNSVLLSSTPDMAIAQPRSVAMRFELLRRASIERRA